MTFPQRILYTIVFFGILGFAAFTGSSSAADGCHPVEPNTKPVEKVHVEIRTDRGVKQIPKGVAIELNATAKDASGIGTGAWDGKPHSWKFEGPYSVVPGTDGCFNPKVSITSDTAGPVTATLTVDGITSNTLSFSVGDTVNPDGSITPGSVGVEDDTYCAYDDGKGGKFCVTGSRSSIDCKDISQCDGKTCTKISLDQCVPGGAPLPPKTVPVDTPPTNDLGGLIRQLFNWSLSILGISVFVMMLYGSFTWLLAGGSPGLAGKGKAIMTDAGLGAILLLAAWLILNTINPDLVGQRTCFRPDPVTGQQVQVPCGLPVIPSNISGTVTQTKPQPLPVTK